MKNTILAIALVAVTALIIGCDNPVNGGDTVTHINIPRGGINFSTSGNIADFTAEQIAAIQEEIEAIPVAHLIGLAPYVDSFTRKPQVAGGRAISFVGEPGAERAVIDSDGTLGGILADLDAGKTAAQAEQQANAQEPRPVLIADPAEFGGINFYAYDNVPQADVDAFLADLRAFESSFYWLRNNYIKSWTLTTDLGGQWYNISLDPETNAGIVISAGMEPFSQGVWGVRDRIIELRVAEPTYFDRESTDSSGNTIRFQISDGVDFADLRAEAEALTDEQVNRYAAHIDVVWQMPAGDWLVDFGGRAVMYESGQGWVLYRDGTHTLAEDLAYARAYITNENGNGNNGTEPAYVMTRDSTDFGSISFYADETIDTHAFINAINEILGNIFNSFSEFISTVKQLPDGALGGEIKVESDGDGEGRVIMRRDGPVDMMALLMDMLGVVEEQLQAASANAFMRGRSR